MQVIIKKTLEHLLQSWNPKLWIKELELPDVDSVMFENRHICCIPKGGKYKSWFEMMADAVRNEGNQTHDGIYHRTLSGLVLTLIQKKIISWDSAKGLQKNFEKLVKIN